MRESKTVWSIKWSRSCQLPVRAVLKRVQVVHKYVFKICNGIFHYLSLTVLRSRSGGNFCFSSDKMLKIAILQYGKLCGIGATGPIADLTDDRFLLGKVFSILVMSNLNELQKRVNGIVTKTFFIKHFLGLFCLSIFTLFDTHKRRYGGYWYRAHC